MDTLKIKGKKFNRLIPIKIIRANQRGNFWLCKCDCGNEVEVLATNIKTGKTKSCGCLVGVKNIERCFKHGLSQTRFYNTFAHIKQRCFNKKNTSYKNYGGRNIKCFWKSFEEFKEDMYKSYLKHEKEFGTKDTTIDRIDNNGNYCKENCRWATILTQNNNTRVINNITFKGNTHSISEWSRIVGIHRTTLLQRYSVLNWSIKKTLTTKPRQNCYNKSLNAIKNS